MNKTTSGILTVNIGSSTVKFALYPAAHHQVDTQIFGGSITGLEPNGKAQISWTLDDIKYHQDLVVPSNEDAFEIALLFLKNLLHQDLQKIKILAVAHRVVHGGSQYTSSVIVNDTILNDLSALNALAPLHQPHNLAGIELFSKVFATVPQIACFDTAFHSHIPKVEQRFAIPKKMSEEGVYRYGFHGLSYQYVSSRLGKMSNACNQKLLMAHLGNGSSLCACVNQKSIATTMGFSAVDGLMMGTRCGNLDAGVLLFLLERGWTHTQIQNLIYKESGLKGVSEISADMRTLRESHSADAKFAIDMYTHKVYRETGALVACMGGIDAIAFTGGIGEHDALLRQEVCQQLQFLGIEIDSTLNSSAPIDNALAVHTPNSRVEVWVIPTDEGRIAAEEAIRLL